MNTSTTSLTPPIEQTVLLRSLGEDASAAGWTLILAAGIILAVPAGAASVPPEARPGIVRIAAVGGIETRSPEASNSPSRLGAALRARRRQILEAGAPTLGWDAIERELQERSGESRQD